MTAWNQGLPIGEIDVLWMTAGLRCDGCLAATAAAMHSGLAEFRGRRLLGIPTVYLDFRFLNFENREANPCLGSEIMALDANKQTGGLLHAFRPALFNPHRTSGNHSLAETFRNDPLAPEKSGTWHKYEQQNAGGACITKEGS